MKLVMGVVAVLAWCTAAGAQVTAPAQGKQVQAELISDWQPGAQSFLVGVHLQIVPGWHIYWKYPGDAGLATSVKWKLPEGWGVSELMWPTPIRFEQEGKIEGIGYEEEVVLLARVTPPQGWNEAATIGVDARWLACEAICVPGKAALQMQVGPKAPADAAQPAQREMVGQWMTRVPVPVESPANPAKVKVTRSGLEYRIELSGIGAEYVQCIVAPADGLSVVSNKVEGRTVQLEFHVLDGTATATEPSEAVVAWTEEGKQRAVSIRLPRP